MNRMKMLLVSLLLTMAAAACSPPPEPQADLAQLQRDIQQATERMYWIHLRLDYLKNLRNDEAMELGQRMQSMAGLDRK